jgi:tRNA(Leu) C34 or U34 (ribose-2'-O)-methylase TrmL
MTTTTADARLRVQIPMPGAADSLHLAATAVVCLFECLGGREAAGGKRSATMVK